MNKQNLFILFLLFLPTRQFFAQVDSMLLKEVKEAFSLIYKDIDQAKVKFNYYYQSIDSTQHPEVYCNILKGMGGIAYYELDYEHAANFYQRMTKCYKDNGKLDQLWKCYYNMAFLYKVKDDYVNTVNYFQKALKNGYEHNNQRAIAYSTSSIGQLYCLVNMHHRSQKLFEESIEAAYAMPKIDTNRIILSKSHLYNTLRVLKKYKKAEILLNEIQVFAEQGVFRGQFEYYIGVANKYMESNPDSALIYIQKFAELIRPSNIVEQRLEYLLLLGNCYINKGNYNAAKSTFTEAEGLLSEIKNVSFDLRLNKLWVRLFEQTNEFKKANDYLKRDTKLHTKLAEKKLAILLSEANARYEDSKKNQILLQQQVELSNQQNQNWSFRLYAAFWTFIATIIFVFFILCLVWQGARKDKQYKKLLETRKQDLEEALCQKKLMIDSVVHELRTPCQTITGMLEILKKPLNNKEWQFYLTTLYYVLNHFSFMIENVITMRQDSMTLVKKPIKLYSMLESILVVIRSLGTCNTFYLDIDPSIPLVYGDEPKLHKILFNLIHNANKYTKNGKVYIAIQNIRKRNNELELLFTIQDTGIGMNDDKMKTIFEKFNFDKMRSEGLGIGLNVVKILLEALGSEIEVISKPGSGSIFRFSLTMTTQLTFSSALYEQENKKLKALYQS